MKLALPHCAKLSKSAILAKQVLVTKNYCTESIDVRSLIVHCTNYPAFINIQAASTTLLVSVSKPEKKGEKPGTWPGKNFENLNAVVGMYLMKMSDGFHRDDYLYRLLLL
jgi:hypothetical protein